MLAWVPARAAAAPAAPELGSDPRPPARAPGRPRALLAIASLGALAELLLPRGAGSSGRAAWGWPGRSRDPAPCARSLEGVGPGLGAGVRAGKEGAHSMSGIRALQTPGTQAIASGPREANKRAAHLGPGLRRDPWLVSGEGAGRVGVGSSPELFTGTLSAPHFLFGHGTCSHFLPGKRALMGREEGAWRGLAGCPGPPGRGRWVMQVCSWAPGRKGLSGWSPPPRGCPEGE